MGRLLNVKTLAGFDFSFQPSLDREPHHGPRRARLRQPPRGRPFPRPARHRQDPPRHRTRRRGGEGRAERLLRHPCRLVGALAKAEREGALRERIRFLCRRSCSSSTRSATCRSSPAAATCSSSWSTPATKGRHDPDLQPRLCRMGRGLRRPRRRHRAARPAAPPRRRRPDRGRQLPPAPPRRPDAGNLPQLGG